MLFGLCGFGLLIEFDVLLVWLIVCSGFSVCVRGLVDIKGDVLCLVECFGLCSDLL